MARKREHRNGGKSQSKDKGAKQNEPSSNEEENYASFNNQLAAFGLALREIPGDGNCLFRALGDQLEGHARNHLKHRHDTVDYMRNHRADFEPFVEDDVPFEKHVNNLHTPGTYAGNDAIVAFARLQGVTVVIHQLNTPLWQISGTAQSQKNVPELHIAFHNGDHYSSVRKLGDDSESPADIRMASQQQKFELPSHKNGYSSNISEKHDANSCTELIVAIMEKTGCQDVIFIQDILQSQNFDLNSTIQSILDCTSHDDDLSTIHYQPNSSALWGPLGSGARLFGQSSTDGNHGAKPRLPNQQLTSKQQEDLKQKAPKHIELRNGANHMAVLAIPDLKCLSI